MESKVSSQRTDFPRLFNELVRFEIELWNAVDAHLRAHHELPLTWFEPMQVIRQHGQCRVKDIAGELSITVGGCSKLVDRIESAGFCVREANQLDQRSSMISLTAAGEAKLAESSVAFCAELERCLDLSEGEAAQVLATLVRLRQRLKE